MNTRFAHAALWPRPTGEGAILHDTTFKMTGGLRDLEEPQTHPPFLEKSLGVDHVRMPQSKSPAASRRQIPARIGRQLGKFDLICLDDLSHVRKG